MKSLNYTAVILCDDGETGMVHFACGQDDDIIAAALDEAQDCMMKYVSVEELWLDED